MILCVIDIFKEKNNNTLISDHIKSDQGQ